MLGGGHGFIQGDHGLVADNLLTARVVLANGSVITVSDTDHQDLFWGLRGAGHNFGIVTEVTVKLYDVPDDDTWYYENFVYTGDAVEEVFAQLSSIKDEAPVQFQHYSVFLRSPDVDPVNVSYPSTARLCTITYVVTINYSNSRYVVIFSDHLLGHLCFQYPLQWPGRRRPEMGRTVSAVQANFGEQRFHNLS